MAYSFVYFDPDCEDKYAEAGRLGEGTNNLAEMMAIERAIDFANWGSGASTVLYTDSALAHKLCSGEAEAHNPDLKIILRDIQVLLRDLDITFAHIPREENTQADTLVKTVLYD